MTFRKVVSACLIVVAFVAALVLAPAAGALVATDSVLPDIDVRENGKPPDSLQRAQERLADSLGSEGFADAAGPFGATSFVGRSDGYLTGASDASARAVTLDYVADHSRAFGLGDAEIEALELTDAYTSIDGVRHLTFSQMLDGVPSYDTFVRSNVTEAGKLVNVSGGPVGGLELDDPQAELGRGEALAAAREDIGGSSSPAFGQLESARLVAFARPDGKAELAWDVYAESADSLLYELVVGADSGEVLLRQSRTEFADQAGIWNSHPSQTLSPTLFNLAADPTWLDDSAGRTRLKGNNTHTYADIGGVNGVDPGEDVPSVGTNWNFAMTFFNQAECPSFGCTWDNTVAGSAATNRAAETTDLFYLTNRFHDHLLAAPIGFDEASRNFERVNSSGQGLGNDHVLAEGDDSSGTNNANFATPPDGTSGRMQMYLWNINWDVSGNGSADVVYHEYTHGLTNRLLGNGGGLSASQSGAMGEGWSDWYANDYLVSTGDKTDGPGEDLGLGEYVLTNFAPVPGIRRQLMDCNPGSVSAMCPANGTTGTGGFTFGDLGHFATNGVHDNGEIWSQTLWDLRERIGSNAAKAVVTGGLRLSPLAPSFLQMRDAILQSAKVLGQPRRPIWEVFAARGMGYSATTPGASVFSAVEAFDLPPVLAHESTVITDPIPLGDGDGILEPQETARVTTSLTNPVGDAVTGVTGELTSPTPGVLVGTPTTSWADFPAADTVRSNAPGFSMTVPAGAACGSSVQLSIAVQSSAGAATVPDRDVSIGAPQFETASPAIAIPDNSPAGVNTTIELPARTIDDIDVSIDSLTHTWVGDLKMVLTSPSATSVTLMNRPGAGVLGSSGDNFTDLVLDDEAAMAIDSIAAVGPFSGSYTPDEPLSAFDGEQALGTWTLNVSDNAGADTGTLQTWGLTSRFECSTSVVLPTAATDGATAVDSSHATLGGTVNPKGTETAYAFDYGTTANYASRSASASAGAGNAGVAKSSRLSGLRPNTTYHFRALALRGGAVIARGGDQTFKTAEASNDACEQARTDLKTATKKLKTATKKLKKAEKKLKKAKKKGQSKKVKKAKKKVKKAKKKVKKAKKKVKKAKKAVAQACP